jgi:hypothetical protein
MPIGSVRVAARMVSSCSRLFGHGSTPVGDGRDRRETSVHRAFLCYVVSPSVLTVAMVQPITTN